MENPNHTAHSNEMFEITNLNYRTIADTLRDEISTKDWINSSLTGSLPAVLPAVENVTGTSGTDIAVESGFALPAVLPAVEGVTGTSGTDIAAGVDRSRPAVEWRLVLSAIVYRRTEQRPEGVCRPIADVVPVWWEFQTVGADGPVSNDFSFSQLKPFIIDYE